MIHDGGAQDAGDDGPRLLEASGQDEGEELGFVANLGESDDTSRDEECFHKRSTAGPKTNDHVASPASAEAKWSKVLPGRETADAMACGPGVDVSLFGRRAATPQ